MGVKGGVIGGLLVWLMGLGPLIEGSVPAHYGQDQTHEAWTPVTLDCHLNTTSDVELFHEDSDLVYVWMLPSNEIVLHPANWSEELFKPCIPETSFIVMDEEHLQVLPNGSLHIDYFGWADRGYYQCLLLDRNTNETWESDKFYVALVHRFRNHVYYFSNLYAVTAALGFLLLTLSFKLFYFVLETYGCCLCCCCCENRLPPKAKKMKSTLDSIEAHKVHQLDKLKENYTQQTEWIRQNCASQMERVRDNYKGQVQNVRDIKHYGSTQIQAVREQYYEQMQRIRDYSSGQMDRVHENYIFQRQRLRKFSAQNYLKVRATGKYTQQTLNRVMDNIPPLYLDLSTCRQGMGNRQESVLFPPEFIIGQLEMDEDGYAKELPFRDDMSLYYTPVGTPLRDLPPPLSPPFPVNMKRTSSLNDSIPLAGDASDQPNQDRPKMRKSKSFSHFSPLVWVPPISFGRNGIDPSRKYSVQDYKSQPPKQQQVTAIVEHIPKDFEHPRDMPNPTEGNHPKGSKDGESDSTGTTHTGASNDPQPGPTNGLNGPNKPSSPGRKDQSPSKNGPIQLGQQSDPSQKEPAFKSPNGSLQANGLRESHANSDELDPLLGGVRETCC
ncbi:hypothetical protein TCAL_05463 [Tigriopus californicus]|uniref:Ig-like domain-containing protein n=1 Tax=Tigriopus californicus TaxID=6832 RepID=A0A553P8N0_TIGCA|nr:uncharacterized protein LOC131877417 [Tigriopus californicus]TRY74044.1 hypothetical protein TCAL_05463 [Tigriopus californicus]|eukprot:TCALIF_05463-PA protein Name:"Similar to ZC262.3 Uncharacterized protein ZC262.3 (Caenorhabditis elegans)" AED:0.00 eAED:0.00 QI:101/1/1/1/1/1/4/919/608